jgi:hypothetical protein
MKKKIGLFFIFASLVFIRSSKANCLDSFANMKLAYTAEHFGRSDFWFDLDRSHNERYSEWAAEQANKVAAQVIKGKSLLEIAEAVAAERGELEVELKFHQFASASLKRPPIEDAYDFFNQTIHLKNKDFFGSPRKNEMAYSMKSQNTPNQVAIVNRAGRNLRKATIEDLKLLREWHFNHWRADKYKGDITDLSWRDNFYSTQSGEKIRASAIVRINSDGTMFIVHAPFKNIELMYTDAMSRLSKIEPNSEKNEKVIREFAISVYGFYSAMPWLRGSSSIGRSFLAGVYLAKFGKQIPKLPDGVDLYAMTSLTQEEFVDDMVPLLMGQK